MVTLVRLAWPGAKEDGQGKVPPGTAERSQKEEQVGKRHDWIKTCPELLKDISRGGCDHPVYELLKGMKAPPAPMES